MKENMPGTHGWVDRGPSRKPEGGDCGTVFVRYWGRLQYPRAPYSDVELARVVRQGRENPRRLGLEESRLATAYRRDAIETLKLRELQHAAG